MSFFPCKWFCFLVTGVRFFCGRRSILGMGKIPRCMWKVAPFWGKTKKERIVFLIVLNLVNLLTNNLHIKLFNIFPSPSSFPLFNSTLFFFQAVIRFGALRECLIPRERKLENVLERVIGTFTFFIWNGTKLLWCLFESEDLSHNFSVENSFHIQHLLNFQLLLTSGVWLWSFI